MSDFFDDHTPEVNTPHDSIVNQLNEQSARFARLTVALEQQRMALQTAEAALITRIADVDDEQHRTLDQLVKKHDSLETRLKRERGIMAGMVLVLALVLTAALAAFYVQFDRTQQRLNGDIAELRDMANTLQRQLPESVTQNQLTQERLRQLSMALAALTPSSPHDVLPPAIVATEMLPPRAASALGVVAEDAAAESPQLAVLHSPPPAVSAYKHRNSPNTASEATEQMPVNDRLYSLQLIGFFSFAELLAYAQRSPLPATVYFQTETYHGRPWFVLIHSLHTSYASAKTTIAHLPPALAQLDLWIRKLPADASVTILKVSESAP